MEGEGDHVRERKYGKTWSPCRNEKIQDLRAELCDLALAARCEKNVLRRLRKKRKFQFQLCSKEAMCDRELTTLSKL